MRLRMRPPLLTYLLKTVVIRVGDGCDILSLGGWM